MDLQTSALGHARAAFSGPPFLVAERACKCLIHKTFRFLGSFQWSPEKVAAFTDSGMAWVLVLVYL